MQRLALLSLLALTACGGSTEDPCSVAVGGVSVNPQTSSEKAPALSCSGTAGGKSLACSDETRLEKTTCTNGVAFTLTSGNAVLLVRLSSENGQWQAGAQVAGETLSGDLAMQGLYNPTLPAPPAGQVQHASFALRGASAVLDGEFSVTW